MIDTFDVRIHADSETVTGTMVFRDAKPSDAEIAFYLSRNGKFVERRPYSRDTSAVFLLQDAGTYTVKGFLKTGDAKAAKSSPAHTHVPRQIQESQSPPDLRFAPLAFPHQDLVVVSSSSSETPRVQAELEALAGSVGCTLSTFATTAGATHVIHAEAGMGPSFFSGMASTTSRLVFGPGEAAVTGAEELRHSVGDFCLVEIDNESAAVSTDYFGVCKMYFFSDRTIACASTRSHLLLLTLRALGAELEVDATSVRAMLQANTQVFTQSFSSSIGVAGCRALAPGQSLLLTAGRIDVGRSPIADILDQPTDQHLSAEEYEHLLAQGCSEIEHNLRVALEHPGFSRVRVDVTGGLDSRTLVTALSRMPEHADHVELHTADFATSPHDLPISLRLSRSMPFRYDTGERATYDIDADTALLENISYHLGTYFGIRTDGSRTRLPGTLCINGFFGEASMRPYFARLLFGRHEEHLDPADFAHSHVESINYSRRPISRDYDLQSAFRSEFENLPGTTSTARFDALYLFHRNGLHCSDRWMSHVRAPSWGPLQSPSLFALKWRTLDSLRGIKVQIDATERLNPDLALVPVGREKDNADRSRYDQKYPPSISGSHQPSASDDDRRRFSMAGRERLKVARRLEGPRSDSLKKKNSKRMERLEAWLLSAAEELRLVHAVLSADEASELRDHIRSEFSSDKGGLQPSASVTSNKVLSALYICRACNT